MKENLIHYRTCVCNINYHMVWSVKYRRKILSAEVEAYLQELVQEIAEDKGFTVHLFECGEGDHVHCFVSAPPKLSITAIVKYLKGISGRKLFERFPEIRNQLWKGELWNHSYYVEMLLSKKTSIKVSREYANLIGHMCYAASKLWNVCNYERQHYKETGMEQYPDWYYQKKAHKEDLWYKQLPSQTAQEVCRLLDKAWKSFYALKRSGGIETPRPPRFKQESIPITYMQMGIVHERDTGRVRLSLPKALKKYMEETYQIHENFLYLENKIFRGMDQIKQLRIYPPEKGNCKIIVVYEVPDQEELPQNGHELSIDLGLHNLMTCYDSGNGKTFILGRKYLALERYFHKEIARVQAQWYGQQSGKGVKYLATSKHIRKLYKRKHDSVTDYLHKVTRYLTEYCREQGITCVVAGDIRNIRREKDLGHRTNQKFHSLPYNRIYIMLEYKLKRYGIRFIKQPANKKSRLN